MGGGHEVEDEQEIKGEHEIEGGREMEGVHYMGRTDMILGKGDMK